MNKREYEEKLNDLQNQINELKNVEIEEEFPQCGDAYWFVSDIVDVAKSLWDNDSVDNYRKDFFRIFKTREECERYLEIQKAFKEASFKPDWHDGNQHKYSVYYDNFNNKIAVFSNCVNQRANDHFESEEVLNNLVNRFGEEDVKKYYLGSAD